MRKLMCMENFPRKNKDNHNELCKYEITRCYVYCNLRMEHRHLLNHQCHQTLQVALHKALGERNHARLHANTTRHNCQMRLEELRTLLGETHQELHRARTDAAWRGSENDARPPLPPIPDAIDESTTTPTAINQPTTTQNQPVSTLTTFVPPSRTTERIMEPSGAS